MPTHTHLSLNIIKEKKFLINIYTSSMDTLGALKLPLKYAWRFPYYGDQTIYTKVLVWDQNKSPEYRGVLNIEVS